MTDGIFTSAYIKAIKEHGGGGEEVNQTIALCHIADMITCIAHDIRALREAHTDEGDTL